jgi:hypothetical protein
MTQRELACDRISPATVDAHISTKLTVLQAPIAAKGSLAAGRLNRQRDFNAVSLYGPFRFSSSCTIEKPGEQDLRSFLH